MSLPLHKLVIPVLSRNSTRSSGKFPVKPKLMFRQVRHCPDLHPLCSWSASPAPGIVFSVTGIYSAPGIRYVYARIYPEFDVYDRIFPIYARSSTENRQLRPDFIRNYAFTTGICPEIRPYDRISSGTTHSRPEFGRNFVFAYGISPEIQLFHMEFAFQ